MNGDLACDSWRRWKDDIDLLRGLGVDSYRMSLSWARILPEGRGRANRAAIDRYRRILEALLEAGIEPWVTMYHWDHPNCLEEAGGWPSREMAYSFGEYASLCLREFGDLAKKWITLNEPWCSSLLSYDRGHHAPGLHDKPAAYRAAHHHLLGHGFAMEAWKADRPKAEPSRGRMGEPLIGIALNLSLPRPATRRKEDLEAASRASDELTGLFMDPLFDRGYPERHIAAHPGVKMPIEAGDMEKIAAPLDFIGVNYYFENVVESVPVSAEHPEGFREIPSWQPETEMDWPIVPQGLARMLRTVDEKYKPKALMITENGCACPDSVDSAGRIRDPDRIAYLKSHLEACEEAVGAGIPLKGYFLWSLMDNFEWAWGYSKRFGLVHIDFRTQVRRPKDSYFWYRDVVAGHGLA
jgi:beta-glucosidase